MVSPLVARGIAGAGAVVLLAGMFLDWYGFDIQGTALTRVAAVDAWGAFRWIDLAMVVAVCAAASLALLGDRAAVVSRPLVVASVGVLI